jgi:flagellin-like protein
MIDRTSTERDTDRGQVGIETLIIFIAMILVAAVAAGVLINTAGFLQNKASSTSEDSESQVSNQVIVISATGTVNATTNGTDHVNNVNTTELNVMSRRARTRLTWMRRPSSGLGRTARPRSRTTPRPGRSPTTRTSTSRRSRTAATPRRC